VLSALRSLGISATETGPDERASRDPVPIRELVDTHGLWLQVVGGSSPSFSTIRYVSSRGSGAWETASPVAEVVA
jgi:hypothetical protein